MADTQDSKPCALKSVRVRVPPPAHMPKSKLPNIDFAWTPNLAYAVGLLATDGNLSPDGRHINFTSKDEELAVSIKACLNLNNKIGRKANGSNTEKRYFVLQFGNVQLYRWLNKIGLTARKSRTIGSLMIPDLFFRDFLRGHLDGDGGITTYIDYYNASIRPGYVYTRLCARFISASENHMRWLKQKIEQILDTYGSLHKAKARSDKHANMWILKFGKKESIKLLSKLYYSRNIPALSRKRLIAEKFIAT